MAILERGQNAAVLLNLASKHATFRAHTNTVVPKCFQEWFVYLSSSLLMYSITTTGAGYDWFRSEVDHITEKRNEYQMYSNILICQ